MQQLETFAHNNQTLPIQFIERTEVTSGVVCDVYKFINENEKDLGIITISPGKKTPKQLILDGEKTVEGYVSGKGKLYVRKKDQLESIYEVGGNQTVNFSIELKKGDSRQWLASNGDELCVYEICYPPYQDGRFKTIT